MKKILYPALGLLLFAVVVFALGWRSKDHTERLREETVRLGTIHDRISANGRTEGISEEIKLSSKVPGRIKTVLVEEGDRVKRGQVVAVLDNDDFKARIEMAKASLDRAQAHLELVINGARPQERQAAKAAVQEAQAIAENARLTYERVRKLYDEGVASKEQVDQVSRDFKAAEAKLESTQQRYNLIMAPARMEDVRSAKADVALARAQLAEAKANYENTFIRSPINGIVLKKYLRPGESITYESLSSPVLSMTDPSKAFVRAEIDETDVSKVRIGQPAWISAKAYPNETFTGKVVRLSGGIGKKQIRTDSPIEKADSEVLETLIELDPNGASKLKFGLRVDVTILTTSSNDTLIVPVQAVYKKGNDFYVKSKDGNGWVEKKVLVGSKDNEHIEIRDGLKLNDTILY